MAKKYEPELGQAVFGQPWKEYDCPEWLIAMLDYLNKELERVMWNRHQEEYLSPFSNTGNEFKCDTFHVQAYSWDEEQDQPYNFKWKDVEISWYKYLGRGTTVNQKIGFNKANKMFEQCLNSIRRMDVSFD